MSKISKSQCQMFSTKYTDQSEIYWNLLFIKIVGIHSKISEDKSYKVEPVYGECSGICIFYFVGESIRLLAKIHH